MDKEESNEWKKIAEVLQDLDNNKDRAFQPVSVAALLFYIVIFAVSFLALVKVLFFIANLFGG